MKTPDLLHVAGVILVRANRDRLSSLETSELGSIPCRTTTDERFLSSSVSRGRVSSSGPIRCNFVNNPLSCHLLIWGANDRTTCDRLKGRPNMTNSDSARGPAE